MATSNRVLWKGAISFGLVHIPVGLHTATMEQGIDFDWLGKRSMDPVMNLVKVKKGETRTVTQPAQAAAGSAEIIDLTELLQHSPKKGIACKPAAQSEAEAPAPARKTARKTEATKPSAPRKRAA